MSRCETLALFCEALLDDMIDLAADRMMCAFRLHCYLRKVDRAESERWAVTADRWREHIEHVLARREEESNGVQA